MNNYELTLLRSQKVEDGNPIINQIQNIIKDEKGVINFLANPQRINLAYPIKENLAADIITIEFSLIAAKIKGIEKQIKLNKDVLRYILIKKNGKGKRTLKIKKSKEKIRPKENIIKVLTNDNQKKEELKNPAKYKQQDKVKFEDIERQLDEIL